jgi:hypothetical protein
VEAGPVIATRADRSPRPTARQVRVRLPLMGELLCLVKVVLGELRSEQGRLLICAPGH